MVRDEAVGPSSQSFFIRKLDARNSRVSTYPKATLSLAFGGGAIVEPLFQQPLQPSCLGLTDLNFWSTLLCKISCKYEQVPKHTELQKSAGKLFSFSNDFNMLISYCGATWPTAAWKSIAIQVQAMLSASGLQTANVHATFECVDLHNTHSHLLKRLSALQCGCWLFSGERSLLFYLVVANTAADTFNH